MDTLEAALAADQRCYDAATEERKQREPYRCCLDARRIACVCEARYECETHGRRCHGSHD